MKFVIRQLEGTSEKTVVKSLKKKVSILSADDVSVFHLNNITDTISHIVFSVKDEYHIGTKLSGSRHNFPINQFINSFHHTKTNTLFIEEINMEYANTIADFLSSMNILNKKYKLDDEQMISCVSKFGGKIKRVELENDDEELETIDYISINALKSKISSENQYIYSLIMLVGDEFVSLYRNGSVSVDNADLKYLTNFIEVFSCK